MSRLTLKEVDSIMSKVFKYVDTHPGGYGIPRDGRHIEAILTVLTLLGIGI